MIDVINGTNTFIASNQTYENIRGYITYKNSQNAIIEFRAETYLEPISRFLILLDNAENEISTTCISDSMFMNGFTKNVPLDNGEKHNVVSVSINRATSPGFPFKVELNSTTNLLIKGLMRATSEKEYNAIPTLVRNN